METKNEKIPPKMGEFKGKPVIQIPLVDEPSSDTSWHWFTFGKSKAKAIVKYLDEIKKFAEEYPKVTFYRVITKLKVAFGFETSVVNGYL